MIPFDSEHLIYCSKICGPIFGNGHDLCISDNCEYDHSFARFPTTYQNSTTFIEGFQSYQKFSGSKTFRFKVKEYEVFQVFGFQGESASSDCNIY